MFMRFFIFLRDTVLPYMLLIIIVWGGLSGIAWMVATTYFWKTSQLTVLVDDTVTSAEIHISSRLVYHDFQFFGVSYPFHIIFPWNKSIVCSNKECIFSGLPRGDAEILFIGDNRTFEPEHIVIEPATQGTLNLRSVILVKEVIDRVWIGLIAQKTHTLPGDISPGSIFYENTLQGLFLFWNNGIVFFYDTSGKQSIMLPQNLMVQSIVRGVQEGTYYLTTAQNEIWLYDRYGREKTQKVLHSTIPNADLIWEDMQTRLKIGKNEQVLPGRVFWFVYNTKNYLFDGEKVFEIINT